MLTARDEEADRVAGLEVGADDYVSKPFSPRSSPRGSRRSSAAASPAARASCSSSATSRRPQAREVAVAGEPVELTGKEFDLLAYLLENAGIVVSRDQLLDRVWGMTYAGGTRTVDVHVAQLRRKLGRPELIRTVRGVGLQGRPAVRLRIAARAAVRGDRARRPALARAGARPRRDPHPPRGRAEHARGTSRRNSTCSPSASARRSCRSPGSSRSRSSSTARTSGSCRCRSTARRACSRPTAPRSCAAAPGSTDAHATARATSTRRGSCGKGFILLRPASSTTRLASAHRGPRRRGARDGRARGADRLPARAGDRPAGPARRRGDPRPRQLEPRRRRSRSRGLASSALLAE